jgi:superfamily II DNA or RNA helicase
VTLQPLIPYPYQREAIDDILRRWDGGSTRVPVVCATGLGKSLIGSTLAREWLDRPENRGTRVLAIAHTIELIDQMAGHMRRANPGRSVGVMMGARNRPSAEIVVGSRQTLASEARLNQLRNVSMIIIDECHFAVRTNTYGKILEHFKAFDDDSPVKVLGLTATLSRSDKQKLSSIWEDCSFTRDIMFGIRNGFLLDVRGERITVDELDMRNVAKKGGDWDAASLGEELERSFAIDTIAKEYARLAGVRKGLAFWPLVATAQHAAQVFNDIGIPSGVVYGAQDKRERAAVLAAHRSGDIKCVHNAMALTVGYDDPTVDVILMGRNTRSRQLYVQMAGRALRTPPGVPRHLWEPALLIDVTGASEDNDLKLFIDLSPERPLKNVYDEHEDATLGELDEFAIAIEEELAEKRAGASFEFESDEYAGPVTTKTFDPLGRSKVWGQTDGGTYYVKASVNDKADAFVFIVESLKGDPGTYDIVQCGVYQPWARGTEHVGLHLDMALSWGEELAGDAYNTRKGSWRKKAPSDAQVRLAARYGIDARMFVTAGDLGEAIDHAQATQRIDPLVASVRSRMQ